MPIAIAVKKDQLYSNLTSTYILAPFYRTGISLPERIGQLAGIICADLYTRGSIDHGPVSPLTMYVGSATEAVIQNNCPFNLIELNRRLLIESATNLARIIGPCWWQHLGYDSSWGLYLYYGVRHDHNFYEPPSDA